MAGKRKKTHWSVRRKNKQAKLEEAKKDGVEIKPRADRRADFPEIVHPGSYAAQYKVQKQKDNDIKDNENEESNDVIKRRFGLWLAFCGKDYCGMQMNEGVKTIEAEVERALFEVGAISETNYGFLQKIGWSRAARTDKGVHAAGQLITAKLLIKDELPVFIEKVNAALPEDIRIMDIMSVTKNFNAKMSCDQRTYEYLAPTFIFQKREKKKKIVEGEAKWPTDLDDVDKEEIVVDDATLKAHMSYRMSDETWTYLNQVLKEYVGTHNFHNFTSKLEPKDPKCNRYITSFIAEKPFVENDMEWVRLRVIGQSFLLHHIRKMIGTAVEIIAGVTDLDTINRGTQLEKMDLPKAPSVGLYLAKAHFKIYNVKLENAINATHPPLDLNEEAMERVEKFKKDFILKHIISHEKKTRTYSKWLQILESLPFSYTTLPYDEWKAQKEKEALLQNRIGKRHFAAAERAKQVLLQANKDNQDVLKE